MVTDLDPTTIEDPAVRQVVCELMNLVEQLSAKVGEQAALIQQLREEIRRLKGEPGQPKLKTNPPTSAPLSSPEAPGTEAQKPKKRSKQAQIAIDRVEVLLVDPPTLPQDAQFKGYEEVVVQDVIFRTDNVKFRKEKYYSPSEKKTYLAPLPAGYHGQFGPGIRAWVLALYFSGGMSEPKILEGLHTVGVVISAGQLSDLLIAHHEGFHAESAEVLRAGLGSSPWQHLDSTGTGVNGQDHQCHILCNPFYTFYCTTQAKDRLSLLRVLQGGEEPLFLYNDFARDLLSQLGVGKKWLRQLVLLLQDWQEGDAAALNARLDAAALPWPPLVRKNIGDALAIAAYRAQLTWPVVQLLLVDDAPQFNFLTAELALCWIHEFRHYKKLMPQFPHHRKILDNFATDFWKLYKQMLLYQQHSSAQEALLRAAEFERLFTPTTGYAPLDDRIAKTRAKKEPLLMALSHPEILLHNNPAELGARQRVRKRDVSLQARTSRGIGAWDTFQTLVGTAKKLGVNIYQYFRDRVEGTYALPSLASRITERAKLSPLGASWQPTAPVVGLG